MKQKWSKEWNSSKQPRKQRKWRANAPLHVRHKLLSAHLSKELRKQYARRAVPLRKGDEVVVKRGEFRKKTGKISSVDMSVLKIFIEGVKAKKVSGQEVDAAMEPSNVMITKLNMDDKERIKSVHKKKVAEAPAKGSVK